MKKIICCAVILFTGLMSFSQATDIAAVEKSVYLFPDFVNGKVHFKNGPDQQAVLNYNTFFQEMIFQQRNSFMAIDNVKAVDTIYIDSSKFIPFDSVFLEVKMEKEKLPYYIQHLCTVSKLDPPTPFGGRSGTGAVQNVSDYRISVATPYQLKVPDDYLVKHSSLFFIKQNNKLVQIKNIKQFSDLFPGKESMLKDFAKQHNINFSKEEDIETLLKFCGSLNQALIK